MPHGDKKAVTTSPRSDHKWQFAPRFRRNAFGWKSEAPIQRIKEAISEIKQVARKEPALAAEGAILLLEKLSPALMHVDSSSGALGSAVNRTIDTMVQIIAKADVDLKIRQQWLERLWQAMQDDEMPYIELLGEYWGELCVTPALASAWADEFLPIVRHIWSPGEPGYGYFKGTSACLSALYTAGRHDEILNLLEQAPFKWWNDRQWGVKALVALGKKSDAIKYAENCRGLNQPDWQVSETCEEILLSSGLVDEAYQRYAIAANQGTTHLATFRAIARKYPYKAPADILRDLASSTPGTEGKWFASAKEAGLFDLAIDLIKRSPTDPRTLIRAAHDYSQSQPAFALASGLAALRWMADGRGYDITALEVREAYEAVMSASRSAGLSDEQTCFIVRGLVDGPMPMQRFMAKIILNEGNL